ncbi:hypothetical protein BDN67DRAFT_985996 [Paxillus ammoniavirescens]|nr:hypothetical protein BDN67DRAFT_985996 [Paxillus ammoniavirescens]
MPARDTSSGFQSDQQEYHISSYSSRIVFKSAEFVLLKQDAGFTRNAWTELSVFLFDHHFMTKAEEDDSVTNYHVIARRRKQSVSEPEPLNPGGAPWIIPQGLVSQQTVHTLFTEDQDARMELKQKLEEAISPRKAAQALNNRFELRLLTTDTFFTAPAPSNDTFPYTARFTCSVPFNTGDGRPHVAVGGADGVWIGLRYDIQSFRRVLPLKMVRQCAILEDFRLFLVLADRVTIFCSKLVARLNQECTGFALSVSPSEGGGEDLAWNTL